MANYTEIIKTASGFNTINVNDGSGRIELIKTKSGYIKIMPTEITTTKDEEDTVISTTIIDKLGYKELIKIGTGYDRIIHPFYINKIQGGYDFTGKMLYSAGESTMTGYGLTGEDQQTEDDFNNSWPFLTADVLGMNKTHVAWPGATVFNWLDVNGYTNVDPTTVEDNEVYGSFYCQMYRILKPLNALTTVRPEVDGVLLLMIGGNDGLIYGIYGDDVTSISPYTTQYCINNAASFDVSGQYVPNYGASSQACFFWCLKKLKTQLPNLKIIMFQFHRLQITSVNSDIIARIDEMNSAFAGYFNTNYGNVYYIPYSEGGTSLGPVLTDNYMTGNYNGHPNQAWNNAMRDWAVPKIQALSSNW
jgi:hypothetical protein